MLRRRLRLVAGAPVSTALLRSHPSSSSSPHALLRRRALHAGSSTRFLSSAWFGSSHPRPPPQTHRLCRCSMAMASSEPAAPASSASQSELLPFIKSAFGRLEGQNYCWVNDTNGIWRTFNHEGLYLVLLYQSCENFSSHGKLSAALERLKYLQQRYPRLDVFAMQCGSAVSSLSAQSQVVCTIVKEYITYPILMSDKDFANITNGACYLLFEGSMDHVLFFKWDEEPEIMIKEIGEFGVLEAGHSDIVSESKVDWQKNEAIKESSVGSFRNLFLYHPGCVSVDEDGDRIFTSDSNHHRIIISNSDGKILDSIGSSPGFEDGEFESAKFLRPAASYYYAFEDCLYVVDSENHSIRKADLGKRILETVYPVFSKRSSGIWSWVMDKLGLTSEVAPKIQDFDVDSIAFPWHLLKISEDDLLIIDRSFQTSWILSMSTGEKCGTIRGRTKVMELCQQMINERCSLLKDTHMNLSSSTKEHADLLENMELVSSVARFQKFIIFCDTDGQRVLKYNLETKNISTIPFSNFGVLGLPYWFGLSLERVSRSGHPTEQVQEHIRHINVLPGRCNMKVFIDIPVGTELAAPLVDSCIWRQVRGSGAEISGSDGLDTTTEKVGVAQQWFDELDNLAFTRPAEEPTPHLDADELSDRIYQEQSSMQFDCAANVSPGTCEVVVSVVLYLKIERTKDDREEQKALVKRIIACQHPVEHVGVDVLIEHCKDARELILMKPLHLRLRLACADHPAGDTNKETVSTESSLQINVSLD